ncbi:hypothetical protein VRRI112168_02345 [Vreelandella rituensis]|uniref:Uncharacterized protein n=1 Tax=Vreelandella rituensis TaxID=2282306 RepID=A0A368U8S6_9GAMM|nr:hypothetical protein [Halomonas rituensis]RCV93588.1 hypothetical protein DU506_00085 [Halomonas rituensis]
MTATDLPTGAQKITFQKPLKLGETVFFVDPCQGLSNGLYTVTWVPSICAAELDEDTYCDSVISLLNVSGGSLEAYPHELYRLPG